MATVRPNESPVPSESSLEIYDEEAGMLPAEAGAIRFSLQESIKRYLALILWLAIIIPNALHGFGYAVPKIFGIDIVVWTRFGLLIVMTQALIRLGLYGVLRWMRKKDAERMVAGSSESVNGDISSYLETIIGPLTALMTTLVMAAVWYSIYPVGCPAINPLDSAAATLGDDEGINLSNAIPIVDDTTNFASMAFKALKETNPRVGHLSLLIGQFLDSFCVFQVVTDSFICSIIINIIIIIESILFKLGLWRFLRSNFQARIVQSRYRTYVAETLRHRLANSSDQIGLNVDQMRQGIISFPFALPFEIPIFGRFLDWMNGKLTGATFGSFDAMIAGRPLALDEYQRKLESWIQRQGLDEAVEKIAKVIPQSDADAKAISKDLFNKLCPPGRDYVSPGDLQTIFAGRAATRDAYYIFDRDQDGSVSKTEFRHTIITVYREMRNLAASVQDAGQAFRKLTDSIHMLVVIGLLFICMAVFGVPVQSIFAIILSLVLGLNVVIGDVAKKSFQGVIFLFVDHPYDVGDRVLVSGISDSDPILIHQINLLTTVFHRWNGQEVYVPNSNLATATIYNISRSSEQWERIDFSLLMKENITDGLGQFRDKLETFLKSKATDYMAAYELKPIIAGENGQSESFLDILSITLRVQCRPTLDSQKRWTRHAKLLTFIKGSLQSCGLQLDGKLKIVS